MELDEEINMWIPKDDPAHRSSQVTTGQEELWEYLSYALYRIHQKKQPENVYWEIIDRVDMVFKADCNGTR